MVSSILDPQTILKYLEILPIKISYINSNNLILTMLVFFNILIMLKNVLLFFAQRYQAYFVFNFQHDLQIKLFKYYIYQPIINLMRNNVATIHRNIIVITESFSHTVLTPILNTISDLIILTILLSALIFAEPLITIGGLFASAIIAFGIFFINKKILLENGEKSKINQSSRIKNFNETFGAILEIKSLNKENLFIKKFKDNTNALRNVQKKLSVLSFFPKLFFEVMGVLLISLFIYVLIQKTNNVNETLPVVVLFTYAIMKIIPIINKILISAQRIRYSRPIMNEIYYIIKEQIIEKKINTEKLLEFENKIDLVDVGFSYNENIHILKKINLSIKKNTFVAIGGDSGSGKSTLLKLILGLLKPTSGEILVDNKPISSSPKKWQENICFVPQDIFILDDSLQNNITLEELSGGVDFPKLHSAIDLSDLRNFTNSLPLGLSTILGDRGSRISGGQKQRIGIARALYANSEIVILDESTSSIDEISELKIYENLKKLKKEKTIIFVTHKKSITKYCDEFYIFENNAFKKFN